MDRPPGPQQLIASLQEQGCRDPDWLRIFAEVPRDRFCRPQDRDRAWEDRALPLEPGATLSQPSVLAAMFDCLQLAAGDRVLEIGSGSGYSTALLCHRVGTVRGLELSPRLVKSARHRLQELGIRNAHVDQGDGWEGDFDRAPWDAIIVHCAVPYLPPALLDQLALGARLVAPVGGAGGQELLTVEAREDGVRRLPGGLSVRFVPARRPGSDFL